MLTRLNKPLCVRPGDYLLFLRAAIDRVYSAGMQETDVPEQPLISIVDDDELMRDSIRQLVKSFGYAVATFSSAMAFLRSPISNRPPA